MTDPTPLPSPLDESKKEAPQKSVSKSILKKVGLIFVIFVLLQIPLMMVNGVMEERQMYNVDYPQQYKGPGAGQQTIVGPVLTIPYHYQVSEEKEVPVGTSTDPTKPAPTKTVKLNRTETGYLHFFPENLAVKGTLAPEMRDEGKFKSILYSTDLEFEGTFNTADFKQKKINEKDLLWKDAFCCSGNFGFTGYP